MTLLSNVVNSSSDVSSHCLNNNNLHTHNNNNNNSSSSLYEKGNTETSLNTTVMDLADEPSNKTTSTTTSYEYTIQDLSLNSEERPKLTTTSTNLTVFNPTVAAAAAASTTSSNATDTTKRYQTKMLLASLIEHFCRAYGDKPDANRKVFFLICQTLRSLGIIDAEFVDEMTSVRSSFQQAFHKLFFTAVQTVRNQDLLRFDDNLPRLITTTASTPSATTDSPRKSSKDLDYFSNNFSSISNTTTSSEPSYSSSFSSSSISSNKMLSATKKTRKEKNNTNNNNDDYFASQSTTIISKSFSSLNTISPPLSTKLSSSSEALRSFMHGGGDFFHNLSVQNSRYDNDFVEINLLGKGGFASAFRARNKLDGIDYAIKKIRLGSDIEEESAQHKENPYEKIFREIKNLARLEHVNVIRYYSSWLEFDDSDNQLMSDEGSDWEEEETSGVTRLMNRKNSASSIFDGEDPTFGDDNLSSIDNFYGYSESGMSHIQFGDSSGGYEAGGNDSSSTSTRPSSISNKKSAGHTPKKPQQTGWTLFIQMQLCPTTLHDYIKFRNKQHNENERNSDDTKVDTERNIEIFSQILEGTAYIHDQGLIHRDLKPSNIFLSMPNSFSYFNGPDGRRKRAASAGGCLESSGYSSSGTSYRSSYDAVVTENGLRECMWEESWVPKIGDFGLAAEAIVEGENENGEPILLPTPISPNPPSPRFPEYTTTTTALSTTDDNSESLGPDHGFLEKTSASTTPTNTSVVSGGGRPKRPKPRRTRTVGVGTRTYASPEQLAVPAQAYDEKVDIYSLGIILFELFHPMATGMERADTLDKLKHGVFPNGFPEMYPKVSALIIWMMNEKASQRPSARQLLEFELFARNEDEDIYEALQAQLQKKTSIIEQLRKRVEQVELEKRIALSEMQQKLDDMQRQLDSYQQQQPHTVDGLSGIKKCISTHSPSSLFKKKKEVRWSVFHPE